MSEQKPIQNKDRVQAVDSVFKTLEILSVHPFGLTLSEVAEMTELSRAAARRYLLSLVGNGYAVQQGRRFCLSSKIVSVARQWLNDGQIWNLAQPILKSVTGELQESCSVGQLSGAEVIYVARSAARRLMSVQIAVGTHLPAYCTSMGQVLLAHLADDARRRMVRDIEFEALTIHSLTSVSELEARLEEVREQGFAVVEEELELGLCSIAVPIRHPNGDVVYALNVSAPKDRFSGEELVGKALPILNDARDEIQRLILE